MSDDTKGVHELARTERPSWREVLRDLLADDVPKRSEDVDDPVEDDWDEP